MTDHKSAGKGVVADASVEIDEVGNTKFLMGGAVVFYFLQHLGRAEVETFLEGLKEQSLTKVLAVMETFSEKGGTWFNDKKVKKLEDFDGVPLFEFKTKCGVRVGWCWSKTQRRSVILLHGFIKDQMKWPSTEISALRTRAKSYNQMVERRGTGNVI